MIKMKWEKMFCDAPGVTKTFFLFSLLSIKEITS